MITKFNDKINKNKDFEQFGETVTSSVTMYQVVCSVCKNSIGVLCLDEKDNKPYQIKSICINCKNNNR